MEIIKTLEKTQIKYTDMKFEDIRKWDIGQRFDSGYESIQFQDD